MKEVTFNFDGENFVVVGASSGIGRQIALELAESGANVLAVARNEDRLKKLQSQYPKKIEIAMIDVLSATDDNWCDILKNFVEQHGKINGGVYTAGITGATPLKMYDENLARSIIETSVGGGYYFYITPQEKKLP